AAGRAGGVHRDWAGGPVEQGGRHGVRAGGQGPGDRRGERAAAAVEESSVRGDGVVLLETVRGGDLDRNRAAQVTGAELTAGQRRREHQDAADPAPPPPPPRGPGEGGPAGQGAS